MHNGPGREGPEAGRGALPLAVARAHGPFRKAQKFTLAATGSDWPAALRKFTGNCDSEWRTPSRSPDSESRGTTVPKCNQALHWQGQCRSV